MRTETWHYVSWDEGNAGEMLLDHRIDPDEAVTVIRPREAFALIIANDKRYLKQLPVSIE